MTSNFPPNIDPNIFSFAGAIAGNVIASNFNSYELNAIGNWLELVGQYILAYASQMQLIEFRKRNNNQSFKNKDNNGPSNQTYQEEIDYLLAAVKKIYQELDILKKKSD